MYKSFGIFVKTFFSNGDYCWYPYKKHYSSFSYALKVALKLPDHADWCIKCYPYPFCDDSECKFRYKGEFIHE